MKRVCLLILFVTLAALPGTLRAFPFEDPLKDAKGSLVLEGVIVRGNKTLPDNEIIHLLDWEVGQEFTAENLARGERRLMESGSFREVELSTRRGSEPGTIIVLVRVREKRMPYVDFLELQPRPDNYRISIAEVAAHTTSRDLGVSLGLPLLADWSGAEFEMWYRPGGDAPVGLRASGGLHATVWDSYSLEDRHGYEVEVSRLYSHAGLRLYRPLPGTLDLLVGVESFTPHLAYDHGTGTDRSDHNEVALDSLPDPLNISAATWAVGRAEYLYDKRDNPLYTQSGFLLHAPVLFGYHPATERSFLSLTLDTRLYLPMSRGRSAAVRGLASVVEGDEPFYYRGSLWRGYMPRSAVPRWYEPPYGAKRVLRGTVLYTHPLTSPRPDTFLTMLIFAEFGAAWTDEAQLVPVQRDYSDPFAGAGVGLKIRVPILGPMSLTYGTPLTNVGDTRRHVVLLTLGSIF